MLKLEKNACVSATSNLHCWKPAWNVPFRPHAALQIKLHVGAFQSTTPQLPAFSPSFRETPAEYQQIEEFLASLPDFKFQTNSISDRLAFIFCAVKLGLLEKLQGMVDAFK